jgi:hypothetical protein
VIDARMHATLTLVGLLTTVVAGPLLPRTWHRRPPRAATDVPVGSPRMETHGTSHASRQPNAYRDVPRRLA